MMSQKKYVVELSVDEREHLKSVISKGKAAARATLKFFSRPIKARLAKGGRMIASARRWKPTKRWSPGCAASWWNKG